MFQLTDEVDSPTPAESQARGRRAFILLLMGIVVAVLAPIEYAHLSNLVSNSPDRSARINGYFAGRAVAGLDIDRRLQPAYGEGTWTMLLQTHREFGSSFDAVLGTLTVCDPRGVVSSATFKHTSLNHGETSPMMFARHGSYQIGMPDFYLSMTASRTRSKSSTTPTVSTSSAFCTAETLTASQRSASSKRHMRRRGHAHVETSDPSSAALQPHRHPAYRANFDQHLQQLLIAKA